MSNSDQTSQIHVHARGQATQEQLRQLAQAASQALVLLKGEQGALRQRGMNLTAGAFEQLNSLELSLQSLSSQFFGVQTELRQLRALADTAALINSTLDVDEVLNQVMDTVIMLTGAERGFVMLKNAAGELEFRVARDIDRAALGSSEFSVSSTVIQQVVTTGEAVLTDNAGSDPRFHEKVSIMRGAFRSILAVPLRVGSVVTGVVYCDNRILTGLFKEHELNLLRAFADQAAVALENARLFAAARAQLAEVARIRDLMANVFDSIASGVITLDLDTRITGMNAAAARITGRDAASVSGLPLADALPELGADAISWLHSALHADQAQGGEVSFVSADGTLRYWKTTWSPLRADEDIIGAVLVLDDLTDTRQREEQFKSVRRYVPLALVENIHTVDLEAVGGQERDITVLFADVRGFTRFSEALEPETLMQVIDRYLGAASDAIDLYEGLIDKYLGDAVTGLFNTPLNPHSDHTARAVRAAIRLTRDVLTLHERLPVEHRLYFGVGIHTGPAVLGSVGSAERREFTAIGDAMDGSKLLQENAYAGEVLLSQPAFMLVQDEFDFEVLKPRKTDGRPDFTAIYRLLGNKRRTSALPSVRVEPG